VKQTEIIPGKDRSVYSTGSSFCLPFTVAPSTTAAPLNRDFTRAVSFMWHRKDWRAESIHAAHAILTRAASLHPDEFGNLEHLSRDNSAAKLT